jgi:proteasome lid subunit RPN8/RPN11
MVSREPRAERGETAAAAPCLPLREIPLQLVCRQAEAGYPEEICGIIVGTPGQPDTVQVRQVPNIANRDPQRDPTGFERDARSAYRMDDRAVLQVLREAEAAGQEVLGFYHSHPDHEAYFSAMDRERATLQGAEPLWPGAFYLVVSVLRGRAIHAKYFAWDGASRDFREVVGAPSCDPSPRPAL